MKTVTSQKEASEADLTTQLSSVKNELASNKQELEQTVTKLTRQAAFANSLEEKPEARGLQLQSSRAVVAQCHEDLDKMQSRLENVKVENKTLAKQRQTRVNGLGKSEAVIKQHFAQLKDCRSKSPPKQLEEQSKLERPDEDLKKRISDLDLGWNRRMTT